MSKYRGTPSYSSYHGRTPRWKVTLAVVLVLVCLLSGGFLLLQEKLVYDGEGNARLPVEPDPQTQEPVTPPEVQVQEPEAPARPKDQKLMLSGARPLTAALRETDKAAAAAMQADGVAVTLREQGAVFFHSATADPAALRGAPDSQDTLTALTGETEWAVARVGCLLDPIAARNNVEGMGLKNTGGYIFYDGRNQNWLDPAKPLTVGYLQGILKDAADLGFHELILTEFSFPTLGKLNKIRYPEAGRAQSLNALMAALRQGLDEAGHREVQLSLEVPAAAISTGLDETAGLDLKALCAAADLCLYAPCTEAEVPALAAAAKALGAKGFVPVLPAPAAAAASWMIAG